MRVGILVFFQILAGSLSSFHSWVLCYLWFVINNFFMLRYIPSISTLVRVFTMNGCWILSNAFSSSIEMIMWYLSFLLLIWCITLLDLYVLKQPCDTEMNPGMVYDIWFLVYGIVYDSFYVLLDSICEILLRIFSSIFIIDIGL